MVRIDRPAIPTAGPGFLARWTAAIVVAAACGVVIAIVIFTPACDPREVIRSDGCGYHVWTYAILKGDPSFQWVDGEPADMALHRLGPDRTGYSCKYPPGVALVRLPAMVWVVDPARNGPPFSLAEHLVCQVLGSVALVGVVVLGLLTCRELGLSAWWSQFAVLVVTFGTGLFHHGTFDAGFSHVYSALGVAWLVWRGARAQRTGGRLSVADVLGIVAVSTLLILIRGTNVFLVAFWVAGSGWWAWSCGNRLTGEWAAILGTVTGFGLTLVLNYYVFGRITLNTYPGEEFVWDRPMMLSVLIARHQGLLTHYPILAVVILVGLLARPSRVAAVGLGLLTLTYAAMYGYWWSWCLGVGFGHRGFVDLVPIAFPVLAAGLGRLASHRPWLARGLAILCLSLAVVTMIFMIDYWYAFMPRRSLSDPTGQDSHVGSLPDFGL